MEVVPTVGDSRGNRTSSRCSGLGIPQQNKWVTRLDGVLVLEAPECSNAY